MQLNMLIWLFLRRSWRMECRILLGKIRRIGCQYYFKTHTYYLVSFFSCIIKPHFTSNIQFIRKTNKILFVSFLICDAIFQCVSLSFFFLVGKLLPNIFSCIIFIDIGLNNIDVRTYWSCHWKRKRLLKSLVFKYQMLKYF